MTIGWSFLTYVRNANAMVCRPRISLICVGPKAQDVLRRYLLRPAEQHCFESQYAEVDHYTEAAYKQAIRAAARRAGVPHWTPNQLRHTAATVTRRDFGLEGAQVHLGHRRANVTEIYAERNLSLAKEIARKIG